MSEPVSGLDYKKPALIGGALVGVLSCIPLVEALNTCLCLWAWVGGGLAAKMLIDRSPTPLTSREGARVGLFAGLLGGGFHFVIKFVLSIFQMDKILAMAASFPFANDDARALYERIQQNGLLKALMAFLFSFLGSLLLLGFTVLGGMVGVALFEKRKGQAPPPPYPPNYPSNYPPNYPPSYPPQGGDSGGGQGGWPSA